MIGLNKSKYLSIILVLAMMFTIVAPGVAWAAGTLTAENSGAELAVPGNKTAGVAFDVTVTIKDDENANMPDTDYAVSITSDKDGGSVGGGGSIAFTDGTADVSVTLTAVDTHTLTVTVNGTEIENALSVVVEVPTVDALALDALVVAPVKDATPDTTAIDAAQYTGTIAWFESDGTTAVAGDFAASTVYVAKATLTAKAGYTLTGVVENSFTYTGATSVANAADAGVVTITFPATAVADATVDALALDALVVAPVKDATPDTTAIDAAQYTGTIAWFESDGTTAVAGDFAASTVYVAKATLTAKAGYTLTGVVENSFTYTGATSVANAADAGVVTITFPATAVATYTLTLTGDNISSTPAAGNLTAGTSVTVTVTPAAGKQVATFTVGGADQKAALAGNQYTFNMPAAAAEVVVTYENIAGHVINITANNTLLVGRHAFNLEQATQDGLAAGKKYTLNNYLTAVDNWIYQQPPGTYHVYYYTGSEWYDLVADTDLNNPITDLNTINGDGLYEFLNMTAL